jgi:hypothetical protein
VREKKKTNYNLPLKSVSLGLAVDREKKKKKKKKTLREKHGFTMVTLGIFQKKKNNDHAFVSWKLAASESASQDGRDPPKEKKTRKKARTRNFENTTFTKTIQKDCHFSRH